MNLNPYVSPAAPAAEPGMISQFMTSRRLVAIIARWTLICAVSAAPSFFWGCVIHHRPAQVMGMIAGIIVFIFGYTMLECSRAYRRVIRWPYVRTTVWVGYGTRLAISILFPLALIIDLWTGMLSVSMVQSQSFDDTAMEQAGFFLVFLTTIVQGSLLNVVLFAYMALVWFLTWSVAAVFNLIRKPKSESGNEAATIEPEPGLLDQLGHEGDR